MSIATWSESPDSRRWKVGLRQFPVGKRHGGTPVGQLVEVLSLLPDVLAEAPTPGEEPEEARVYWGWSSWAESRRRPAPRIRPDIPQTAVLRRAGAAERVTRDC